MHEASDLQALLDRADEIEAAYREPPEVRAIYEIEERIEHEVREAEARAAASMSVSYTALMRALARRRVPRRRIESYGWHATGRMRTGRGQGTGRS